MKSGCVIATWFMLKCMNAGMNNVGMTIGKNVKMIK